MATVTGLTADRMQEIIDAQIDTAEIVGTHLILTLNDGSTLDAGDVGSSDYRSRINLALGLMGTTFCFFNNKADQPVDLMYYADGDLDRHTVLYAVGLNNSVEDPDFAPQIVNGEMIVPRSEDGTSSAGYPMAIINERFNSCAIVGGFMPRVDEENPPTNLSGFALIATKAATVDPLEAILDGSVHVGFYANGIQVGVVHPVGTSAPAGPGLEVLSIATYSYPVPIDGELNKVMGYRFVEPNFLYVTGPSGQVRRFESDYFAEYWPDDNVGSFIFEIAHNGATMDTDPEPRLIGFAMGEPGTYNYLTADSTDFTDLETLVADNDAAALHKAIAGEFNAMTAKATPIGADLVVIEDSAAAFAKKKATIDSIIAIATAAIIDTAPATLDTLNELAAALADDPNFATTMTTALAGKAPLATPTFTGQVLLPDGTVGAPGLAWSADSNTGFYRFDFGGQFFRAVVNGTFRQEWPSAGPVKIQGGTEATLADGTGEVQIGANLGPNLGLDGNEIQARNGAGAANALELNPHGGNVSIGGVVITPSAFGVTIIDDANAEAARRTLLIPDVGHPRTAAAVVQYGVPGVEFHGLQAGAMVAGVDYYEPFRVLEPVTLDLMAIDVTVAPLSDTTFYYAIYAADTNLQPTGAPLLSDSLAVTTAGSTGVKSEAIASLVLPPGEYLAAHNCGVNITVRGGTAPTRGIVPTMGASGLIAQYWVARASAAFANPGTAWTNTTGSTVGMIHQLLFRWT